MVVLFQEWLESGKYALIGAAAQLGIKLIFISVTEFDTSIGIVNVLHLLYVSCHKS